MTDSVLLDEARRVMKTLLVSGYEAYLVGGFVRDHVLGIPVHDIDIATSAAPETVLQLFKRAVPTGIEHGTVTVMSGDASFEVTTFRRDGEYEDHRRPDTVEYVDSLHEDLARRDFTMNAMAMDIHGNLIDPFGGRADLESGLLRCVGEAGRRFAEDALRMMRCIRFAANYDLEIDEAAWMALEEQRSLLKYVAMERVSVELVKTIEGKHPGRGVSLLIRSGLLAWTKAQLDWHPFAKSEPVAAAEENWRKLDLDRLRRLTPLARWAVLFIAGGHRSDEADSIMRRLTFSNEMRSRILHVMRLHEHMLGLTSDPLSSLERENIDLLRRRFMEGALTFGKPATLAYLEIRDCYYDERWNAGLQEVDDWLREIQSWSISELAVNGHDLLSLSRPKGPWIGRLLHRLLLERSLTNLPNTKEALLKRAEQILEREEGSTDG